MKKILIVLAASFTIVACKDAEKKVDATASKGADSATAVSSAVNQPATVSQTVPVVDSASKTTVQWLDGLDKDFGKVKEGETVNVVFKFKNTGTKPLVIAKVWAQCGCTVPETPQKPYAPGETGEIKASFNSSAKQGMQTKEVYMSANTNPETTTLVFHVDVKAKS